MITLNSARNYLFTNKRYIKYTVIARELGIDKNSMKDFIDNKTNLKPEQQDKLKKFVVTKLNMPFIF